MEFRSENSQLSIQPETQGNTSADCRGSCFVYSARGAAVISLNSALCLFIRQHCVWGPFQTVESPKKAQKCKTWYCIVPQRKLVYNIRAKRRRYTLTLSSLSWERVVRGLKFFTALCEVTNDNRSAKGFTDKF